jgi:hypothetical protein
VANGASGWSNLYSVVGPRDALVALLGTTDFRFEDHGQQVLADGTLSLTAYATDAAAAAASAAQPGVTITLLLTGDQRLAQAQDVIASLGEGNV